MNQPLQEMPVTTGCAKVEMAAAISRVDGGDADQTPNARVCGWEDACGASCGALVVAYATGARLCQEFRAMLRQTPDAV